MKPYSRYLRLAACFFLGMIVSQFAILHDWTHMVIGILAMAAVIGSGITDIVQGRVDKSKDVR